MGRGPAHAHAAVAVDVSPLREWRGGDRDVPADAEVRLRGDTVVEDAGDRLVMHRAPHLARHRVPVPLYGAGADDDAPVRLPAGNRNADAETAGAQCGGGEAAVVVVLIQLLPGHVRPAH